MADQMPPPEAAQAAPQEGGNPGGMSQVVADVNTGLMKIMDAVSAKFPEDAQKLQAVIQGYQSFVEGLGGGEQPAPGPGGNVPAQAGAANVQPVM